MTKSKTAYFYALGRRRAAVVTVKLFPEPGPSTVNGLALDKYFPAKYFADIYQAPLTLTKNQKKFHFQAKAVGGGKNGQAVALSLALARALIVFDPELKKLLRPAGLVTVDARVRQRRMVGTGGKARRKKQSPKR